MVYDIAYCVIGTIMRIFFRMKSIGSENLPLNGGAVVACNHISLWDPPLLGCGLPRKRQLHMMAKEELFKIPIFSWCITHMASFPVRRGGADRNAIRTAVNLLTSGEVVGIFPEGTRSKNGEMGEWQPGMAMIAVKAGVPIVPAVVTGTNKIFKDGHFLPTFKVQYAAPVYPLPTNTDKENIEYMSAAVRQEIQALLKREAGK